MGNIDNENPRERDEDAEIAAVLLDLDNGQLRSALNRLSDFLAGRTDRLSIYLGSGTTDLLAELNRLEDARQAARLGPGQLEDRLRRLKSETREFCKVLTSRAGGSSDASAEARNGAATSPRAGTPLGVDKGVDDGTVLHARGIGKTHRSTGFVLFPLDLKVRPGQIVGVVGVNGSGKSTLLDLVRGYIAPDIGDIAYPLITSDPKDWIRIRQAIGHVPQRSSVWKGTVRANLEYAAALHKRYGQDNATLVDRLLARHGLTNYQNHTWSQLSSGYRLRFDLVMARIPNPRLMIFDEPLANLDPVSQQTFLGDLKQLAKGQSGYAPGIVLTSQHLYELESIVDRDNIIVLSGGRRLDIAPDRPLAHFEIWGEKLTTQTLREALKGLMPDQQATPAESKSMPAGIRAGSTMFLVTLAKGKTVADVADAMKQAMLEATCIRDITTSARVELEAPQREVEETFTGSL